MWHDADGIAVDELSLIMVNDPDFIKQLRMSEIRRNKKDQPYLLLPKPLARGRYLIEEKWSDDDDLFCDAPAFHPPALLGENVFTVCPPTAEQTAALRAGAAKLLEIALICPQNTGVLSETVQSMRRMMGASVRLSGEKEMKLLLTMAVHLFRVVGTACEANDLLAELLFLFATKSLDDEARGDLTALVLASRFTYEERSFCFKRLNLFLSIPAGVRLGGEALTLLSELNGQAALLWRLRTGQPGYRRPACSRRRPGRGENADGLSSKAVVRGTRLVWVSGQDYVWPLPLRDNCVAGIHRRQVVRLPTNVQLGEGVRRYRAIDRAQAKGRDVLLRRDVYRPDGPLALRIPAAAGCGQKASPRRMPAPSQEPGGFISTARSSHRFPRASVQACARAAKIGMEALFRSFMHPRWRHCSTYFMPAALSGRQNMPARNLLIQTMYVIPDLVRRDVILAEFYLLFTKGRVSDVHESHFNQANG